MKKADGHMHPNARNCTHPSADPFHTGRYMPVFTQETMESATRDKVAFK
jgi:hypothetical protein